jgi:chromosome segregation ATPase
LGDAISCSRANDCCGRTAVDDAMTTQSKSRHIRADSGLGDIDTFSKNLSNAQSFCAAVASLTSENGFQALTELLELLPQRDNEIKKRDNTIRDLNAQLAAQEKSHNDYNEKQLLTFEHRYHGWNEENISLQSSIEKLEAAAVVKDTEITALQDQLSVIEGKVKDLDEEHTQTTKRLKDRELQLVELGAQLRNSEVNADDYKDRQRQSSEQMAALQRSYNEEVRQHRLLMEEATKRRERLMHLTSLSVKIEDLSLPTV